MSLYPVHGKQRRTRLCAALAQPGLVGDVIDGVKRRRRQQGVQQKLHRHHLDVKLEHQQAGQRKTEIERQQIQQRKEDVEVKAHAPKLPVGQRQNKRQADQIDDKQAAELRQRHECSPAANAEACCQPST